MPTRRVTPKAMALVSAVTTSASTTTSLPSWSMQLADRDPQEQGQHRDHQEGQRDQRRQAQDQREGADPDPAQSLQPVPGQGGAHRELLGFGLGFGGKRKPGLGHELPAARAGGLRHEGAGLREVRRALHDGDLVTDLRLREHRDGDRLQLRGRDARVGDVDEPGVGLAEHDLADDLLHVGLLAHHVAQGARDAEVAQHGAGVRADRHARVRHHQLDAAAGEVVDARDAGRVALRHDQRQAVEAEELRLLDQAVAVELLGEVRRRRGEDVGRRALADLQGQGVRAGEAVAGARVDLREHLGQRGGGEDRGLRGRLGGAEADQQRQGGEGDCEARPHGRYLASSSAAVGRPCTEGKGSPIGGPARPVRYARISASLAATCANSLRMDESATVVSAPR